MNVDRVTEDDLELVDPSTLEPHPDNPRVHDDALIKSSITDHGVIDTTVVQRSRRRILGGHGRWENAVTLGATRIPVLWVDCDDAEAEEIMLVLNRTADQGSYNLTALQAVLERVRGGDDIERLKRSGWTEQALERVRREVAAQTAATSPPNPDKEHAAALRKEYKTQPGQLWAIAGSQAHRLIIGDATDPPVLAALMGDELAASVYTDPPVLAALMGDELAASVYTDPPYGISYEAPSGEHEVMAGDDLRGDALVELVATVLKLAVTHATPDAAFYIWHAAATRDEYAWALKQAGLVELEYIIWAKPSAGYGYGPYRHAYEPCFYAAAQDTQPPFYGDHGEDTVWRFAPVRDHRGNTLAIGTGVAVSDGAGNELWVTPKVPKRRRLRTVRLEAGEPVHLDRSAGVSDVWEISRDHRPLHPTQKPVDLAVRAIVNSTLPDEIILDPFAGSGSTILGAEQAGRRGHGVELSPEYAAVILHRATTLGATTQLID